MCDANMRIHANDANKEVTSLIRVILVLTRRLASGQLFS